MIKDFILIATLLISALIIFVLLRVSQYAFKGRELMKKLKESEKNYRALAERYETVVGNIREVIFQLDIEGIILYLNNSWVTLTGLRLKNRLERISLIMSWMKRLKELTAESRQKY